MIEKAFRLFVRNAPEPFVVGRMLLGAILGNEIGHAGAGNRGFEAGSLRDGPFGHVAAVGPPTNAETIRIGDAFGQKIVDTPSDILEISAAPVGAIAFDKFLAVAYRATNVGIENRVAARGEQLAPDFDGGFPGAGGATVDQSDERKFGFAIVVGRLEEGRFDE